MVASRPLPKLESSAVVVVSLVLSLAGVELMMEVSGVRIEVPWGENEVDHKSLLRSVPLVQLEFVF